MPLVAKDYHWNIAVEIRAATVLYRFLKGLPKDHRPWIIPANACPIVPLIFLRAEIPFIFVDIEADRLMMNQATVLSHLYNDLDAYCGLLFIHTYGAELPSSEEFLRELRLIQPNLVIIDDRCACRPRIHLVPDAEYADLILFSTGYGKYIDLGWGGYGFIKETFRYAEQRSTYFPNALKRLEVELKEAHKTPPFSGNVESPWLDMSEPPLLDWSKYTQEIHKACNAQAIHKSNLNKIYRSLPEYVQYSEEYQHWRFNIKTPHASSILKRLFEKGLFASQHYASCPRVFGYGQASISDHIQKQTLNLFNDQHYTCEKAEKTVKVIQEYV